MSEDPVPYGRQNLEACPACGSQRIVCLVGLFDRLDMCIACKRVWEPLRPADPFMVDGEMMPFATPCDNCAFRGGSEERKREGGEFWRDLQQELAFGGRFYCHKGVPFSVVDSKTGLVDPGERGFEFPRKEARADIAGQCYPYQQYDTERMRLCRGYLNAHIAPLMKERSMLTTHPPEEGQ